MVALVQGEAVFEQQLIKHSFSQVVSIAFGDLLINSVRLMLSNMCIAVLVTEIICLSQSWVCLRVEVLSDSLAPGNLTL